MKFSRFAIFLVLLFVLLPSAWSTLSAQPAWVLYQIAERHFRQREFARALEMYGEALSAQPVFPEAMVGMARVHRAAGDTTLARRYYIDALRDSRHMDIPDEEYAIRLELARLYAVSGTEEDLRQRREQLETVVARDPVFSRAQNPVLRDAMKDLLYRSGLDRVLVLYRLDFPQSRAAHRQLGELLLESSQSGDRDLAVEHFLFSAVEIAGRAVRTVIEIQFNYEFTTLENLLSMAEQYPEVSRYLVQTEFFSVLTGLANALELSSPPEASARAEEIRRVLP